MLWFLRLVAFSTLQGECKQLQDTEKLLKDTAKRLLDVARRETGVSDPEKLSMELKKVQYST